MNALLTMVLGRLPIGWLQLMHSKARLAAAIAGVAFANILVLVQLGIMGALNNSILISYDLMRADIMISAPNADTLTSGDNVARQRMFQALAVPGVASAMPFYVGTVEWQPETGRALSFRVIGVDPNQPDYLAPNLAPMVAPLRLRDTALIDQATRGIDAEAIARIGPGDPLRLEVSGMTLTAVAAFEGGGGFAADGYLIVSDQTFLRLLPRRQAGAPDHILIKTERGADPEAVAAAIDREMAGTGLRVRTLEQAAFDDQDYQTTERPTGLIFGFGVVIGILVGIVIVYQILSTDVADHLREYATFKAMGYAHRMFLGIILEEAVILGILGFIPGIVGSMLIYQVLSSATGLPVILTLPTAIAVFVGTIIACTISGVIATRRLQAADPADLF